MVCQINTPIDVGIVCTKHHHPHHPLPGFLRWQASSVRCVAAIYWWARKQTLETSCGGLISFNENYINSFIHCWFDVFLFSESVKSFSADHPVTDGENCWSDPCRARQSHVFLYFETYSTGLDSVSVLVLFSFVTPEVNDSGYTKLMRTYSTIHHDLSFQQQIAFTQT